MQLRRKGLLGINEYEKTLEEIENILLNKEQMINI